MATPAVDTNRRRRAVPTAYAITLHTNLRPEDPRTSLVGRLLWEYLRSHGGPDGDEDEIYSQLIHHQPQAGGGSDAFKVVWHFTLDQWAEYGSILYGILCGAFQRVHPHMYVHVYLPPVTPWGPAPGVVEEWPGQQYQTIIGKPLQEVVFSDVIPGFVALLSYRDRHGLWTEID